MDELKSRGSKIGFVPTMGALHEGHISLINSSRSQSDITICSIFVNPAQFNDPDDFKKYPVSLENDIRMLEKAGTDIAFIPSVKEIYPQGDSGLETYVLGALETILEGRYRPGHFQGVCQVMSRLLRLVEPQHLFMGQKDFQQCLVVKRLIHLLDLKVEFHLAPTQREDSGLALSSRNRRLTTIQKLHARSIFQTLIEIKQQLSIGDTGPLIEMTVKKLNESDFKTDYVSIARQDNLQPVSSWDGRDQIIALIAAFQGEVRLIDNMLLN